MVAYLSCSALDAAEITSTCFIPSAFSMYLIEFAFSSASTAFALVFCSSALDFKTCFDFSIISSSFWCSSSWILFAFSISKVLTSFSDSILWASIFFCCSIFAFLTCCSAIIWASSDSLCLSDCSFTISAFSWALFVSTNLCFSSLAYSLSLSKLRIFISVSKFFCLISSAASCSREFCSFLLFSISSINLVSVSFLSTSITWFWEIFATSIASWLWISASSASLSFSAFCLIVSVLSFAFWIAISLSCWYLENSSFFLISNSFWTVSKFLFSIEILVSWVISFLFFFLFLSVS